MKHLFQTGLAIVLAGVVIAGLAGSRDAATVQDKHEVMRISGKMKTVCVGRFLIDVPAEAEIELRQARINGFDISVFNETEEEFQKRVGDREAEINAKPDYLGGSKNMESAREVKTASGLVGKIFIHSRTVAEGTQGDGLGGVERYRDEGITTEALVHGHGISIGLFYENRALKWIEDLPRLVEQLVVNADNRIPTEPGFCMDRAFVRDPLSADQREQVMMFGRLPSHPDVEFMFIVSAGQKPEAQGILERNEAADEALSMAERMRVTRLRPAARKIGGLDGEELAELVVEENEARGHSFWWEVTGTEDNVFVPRLVFRMSTGNGNRQPVPSSLSDGAALGLWDKISSSIRVRPTESVAKRPVEVSTTPLGTYASAGERGPEGGWWRCEESHALDETRWVAHGALLPPATFAVSPGVFGGSTNAPNSIQRRGEWRLVMLAGMPESAAGEHGGAGSMHGSPHFRRDA